VPRKFHRVSRTEAADWAERFAQGEPINKIANSTDRQWMTVRAAIDRYEKEMDRVIEDRPPNGIDHIPSLNIQLVCFDCRAVDEGPAAFAKHNTHDYIVLKGELPSKDTIYRVTLDLHAESVRLLVLELGDWGELVDIHERDK